MEGRTLPREERQGLYGYICEKKLLELKKLSTRQKLWKRFFGDYFTRHFLKRHGIKLDNF